MRYVTCFVVSGSAILYSYVHICIVQSLYWECSCNVCAYCRQSVRIVVEN